jgi:hypothetical protein
MGTDLSIYIVCFLIYNWARPCDPRPIDLSPPSSEVTPWVCGPQCDLRPQLLLSKRYFVTKSNLRYKVQFVLLKK